MTRERRVTRFCKVLLGHMDPLAHQDECQGCWNAVNRTDFQEIFGLPVTAPIGGGTRSPLSAFRPSYRPPGRSQGVKTRVQKCGNTGLWDWAVVEEERVLDSGSEKTEEGASKEAAEARGSILLERSTEMRWSYGIMTVPERKERLLPKTVKSLAAGGFTEPRLFVDGENNLRWWEEKFGFPITLRWPKVGTHANYVLGLYELYLRDPTADRFVLFQDDIVVYKNLRQYLEKVPYPEQGYCNIYTMHTNEALTVPPYGVGWHPTPPLTFGTKYHDRMQQRGLGAVGLIFNQAAVQALLSASHLVMRVLGVNGHEKVDGGIVESMNKANFWEHCHNPSLCQHTGDLSAMGHQPHPKANSFRGEEFNALELLKTLSS